MKLIFVSEEGTRICDSPAEFESVQRAQHDALVKLAEWVKAQPIDGDYIGSAITGFADTGEVLFRVVLEASFTSGIDTLDAGSVAH